MANGTATATDSSEPTKTIFVGQLSWNVDNDWLAQEFAECGEVVDARVQTDRNTGRSRGFAYVTFATEEAFEAALKFNGKEIDGRPVKIDKSTPKSPQEKREGRAKAFGDTPSEPSATLFVGGLSWDATEDMVWNSFSEYGDIKSVRLPTDRESGRPKGFGYVEFSDVEMATKAYAGLNGAEIAGRAIRLDYSTPRDGNGGGGRGRGFGGDRGNRGRGRVSPMYHVGLRLQLTLLPRGSVIDSVVDLVATVVAVAEDAAGIVDVVATAGAGAVAGVGVTEVVLSAPVPSRNPEARRSPSTNKLVLRIAFMSCYLCFSRLFGLCIACSSEQTVMAEAVRSNAMDKPTNLTMMTCNKAL